MTDAKAETDGPPPIAVDVQDPLPESNFFWRRWFSYLLTFAVWGLLVFVVYKMEQPESLRIAALYLSLLLWFSMTYYMVAPSAEQITRIIQAARNLRSGVVVTRTAEADRDHAQVSTRAGREDRDEPQARTSQLPLPDRDRRDAAPTSSRPRRPQR